MSALEEKRKDEMGRASSEAGGTADTGDAEELQVMVEQLEGRPKWIPCALLLIFSLSCSNSAQLFPMMLNCFPETRRYNSKKCPKNSTCTQKAAKTSLKRPKSQENA